MAKKDMNNEKKKNNFSKELAAEMKKVTWPTFKQLVTNTSGVISIVLIVAIIVFILDVCFENLNRFGVENLKTLVASEQGESQDNQDNEDETQEETDTTLDEDGVLMTEDGTVIEPDVTSDSETNTEQTEQQTTNEVDQQ